MREKRNENLEKLLGEIFASQYFTGRSNAFSRDRLIGIVQRSYPTADEREIREALHELRRQGMPICSTGGIHSGYWRAADREELEEYLTREVHSRAVDLLETESILRRAADRTWGPQQLAMELATEPEGA
jgi:hypothetical protein